MSDKKKLPELLETLKSEFVSEIKILNPLVAYEVVLLEIEERIKSESSDSTLGNDILDLINKFREKNG